MGSGGSSDGSPHDTVVRASGSPRVPAAEDEAPGGYSVWKTVWGNRDAVAIVVKMEIVRGMGRQRPQPKQLADLGRRAKSGKGRR